MTEPLVGLALIFAGGPVACIAFLYAGLVAMGHLTPPNLREMRWAIALGFAALAVVVAGIVNIL